MYCEKCGTYMQPITRSCPRCGAANKNSIYLYPPKADSSYRSLIYWQRMIVANSPDRLVYSKDQLEQGSLTIIIRSFEIVADSDNLINSTANPKVFFERLDLLHENLSRLIRLEPFYDYDKPLPSDILLRLCQNENLYTKNFIDRYFYKTSEYANKLKTVKGKADQFEKFISSLKPYFRRIYKDNYQYIFSLYTRALNDLCENSEVNVIDKPKTEVKCKNYDLSTIQGIRQIPYNDYSVMRDLQKCATKHKRNGDLLLAVECLKKPTRFQIISLIRALNYRRRNTCG